MTQMSAQLEGYTSDAIHAVELQATPASEPGQWYVDGVLVARCDTPEEAIALYQASHSQTEEPAQELEQ